MVIRMKGVKIYPLKHIKVPKGDILHALKCTDEGYAGFGEVYFSQIESGAIKGWKRHNRMPLNIIVPIGAIEFIIYDDRELSSTYGQFMKIEISSDTNYVRLTVEPGLWMSFKGISQGVSMLMNIIPIPHDPSEVDKKELSDIPYYL